MSVQTGSMPPPAPMSTRFVDRARFRVDLWRSAPNPIWIRELRQSARLARTPIFLAVLTILMTLLIAGVGGVVSTWDSPATTGVVIFQTFFSLAYFLVTLIGPAVAANSIASEREGKTWEAVLLTGLSPGVVARGKFLAAFTSIAMYLVMLAPVAALPFLFGGVTATEVVVAFAGLFLIALLAIAFGLAMSSLMSSVRAAILVTLLLAVPISIIAFLTFGVSLSFAAHRAWPGVAEGPPIWLPTAYERAPFDAEYLVFLVLLPVIGVSLPAWFLYEVTIANLTSVTDDRSSGLKRWFLVAAPLLTVVSLALVLRVTALVRANIAVACIAAVFLFLHFCVFLFVGEPIGPSRRVIAQWDLARTGRLRRFLGPGVMRASTLLLAAGAMIALIALVGAERCAAASGVASDDVTAVLAFGGYALAFHVFVVGLGAFIRSRAQSAISARVLLFAILFAISVGPWVITAIAGLIGDHFDRSAFLVAAPSPFFAFVMVEAATRGGAAPALIIGAIVAGGWAALGLALLAAAGRRCKAIIDKHEAVLDETDRLLAAEDEAAAAARMQAASTEAASVEEEPAPATVPAGG